MTTTTSIEIKIGTTVRDDRGDSYIFEEESPGRFTITFRIGSGGLAGIRCGMDAVIPADAVPEGFPTAADLKAAAVDADVTNDKAGRPNSWSGSWRATVGERMPRWFKTKRDAVAFAAWRALIDSYHGGEGDVFA
ncbi:hypothetical protein ACI7YT_12505 [Microbacterium sp. M]|uniref:hypothetical protein n=1 Tax=Microbacterium sp. M TaxID=3377125 RepID=UPI0038686157